MLAAEIAIIGGTGLEELVEGSQSSIIGTPYGLSPRIRVGRIGERPVAFLPRHGDKHDLAPHRVNYRANIWALHNLGVKRILATNAVGAINESYKPGDLALPKDLIDFTKQRPLTLHEAVTHVDVSEPYCPELRSLVAESGTKNGKKIWTDSILAATEGPRFETPAEIRMMKNAGCDLVGMTGAPEAFLARELEVCYASICFISNMAAGLQKRLTSDEVFQLAEKVMPKIRQLIRETVPAIPAKRTCVCSRALENARI